jgi:hypothetical protein
VADHPQPIQRNTLNYSSGSVGSIEEQGAWLRVRVFACVCACALMGGTELACAATGYMRDDAEIPDRGSVGSIQSVLNLPPHLRTVQQGAPGVRVPPPPHALWGDGRLTWAQLVQPVVPGDQVRGLYDYSDPDKLSFMEARASPPSSPSIVPTQCTPCHQRSN